LVIRGNIDATKIALGRSLVLSNGRLRVLASAFACNPYKGSEHGVGWGWVMAIARAHDLHVLVADFEREDIQKWLAGHPELHERAVFHFVPHRFYHYTNKSGFWRKIENSALKPIMNLSYRLWLRDSYKVARKLNREHAFEVAHLITYVGFRFPGHLWKLNVPFVWGPIGGLENTPWQLLPLLGIRGALYYAMRNLINTYHKKCLVSCKRALNKAGAGIIAATEGIRKEIRKHYGIDSTVICEVGPPECIATHHSTRQDGEPIVLSWSGEHLPGKALPLLLRSLGKLRADVDWRLEILGDGPCMKQWKELALKLGISKRCCWHGRTVREDAIRIIRDSHVFVITSLKDLTSSVLLEALSQGLPIVCLNHCGFADIVDDTCGIKIPIDNVPSIPDLFAKAIVRLWSNEMLRQKMAKSALEKVRRFTWGKKMDVVNELYASVTGKRSVIRKRQQLCSTIVEEKFRDKRVTTKRA
jgi:glycosyltransferase involved in cell wall biosynthesis